MRELRYVDRYRGRDGVTRYYFRIDKTARTKLPGEPGDPAFMFAYATAFTARTGKTLPPRLQPPTSFVLRMKAAEITRALNASFPKFRRSPNFIPDKSIT